jgi:hypothetical protein
MAQILIKLRFSRFLHFVAMMFYSNKKSTPLKIFQIGAVGELVWTNCGNKWPARHSKLSTRPKIGKLQILHPWTEQGFIFHIM